MSLILAGSISLDSTFNALQINYSLFYFRVSKCSGSSVISNEAYLLFFELSWHIYGVYLIYMLFAMYLIDMPCISGH
jgi:hypothetical protein